MIAVGAVGEEAVAAAQTVTGVAAAVRTKPVTVAAVLMKVTAHQISGMEEVAIQPKNLVSVELYG